MAVLSGSCCCGNVKYEVTEQPVQKALCHCHQCQKVSGSAYTTNILVPKDAYKITSGTPKQYTFTQAPSGIKFTVSFCGDCSSPVGKGSDDKAFSTVYIVPAGTLDGDKGIEAGKPDAELWTPMRATWLSGVGDAAQLQGFA